MKGQAVVDAGICGFHTTVVADCSDARRVTFSMDTECDVVARFVSALRERQPIDVYGEIDRRKQSVVSATAHEALKECYKSCPVPLAVHKAMQVAAGLALPRDVRIEVSSVKGGQGG
jgi:hypothetical protein